MSEPETKDQDVLRVRAAIDSIIEHFDAVQVFATRSDGTTDGTIVVALGQGNWCTRYGMIQDWIIKEDEQTRMRARREEEES